MRPIIILFALALSSVPCIAKQPLINPPPHLTTETLPATGKHASILSVENFGRYAVVAQSPQGTALQYVDRMAGPSEIYGIAGEKDGRLDLFLNQGDYKIITHADTAGTGEVKLAAHGFTELNELPFPQLVKLKAIHLALEDFQQRSFWLHITRRETVAIEAAGRNLADMRLWKDGNWLLDASPVIKQVYPHPDKPLQVAQLNTTLEPGLYLLTTYGGPTQAWTVQSDEHPLYIRYGIPHLDVAGQQQFTVSVFGSDRYRVPGNSNYFNVSVPESTAVSMTVGTFQESNAFDESGSTAQITKKSLPPVAELELSTQNADRIVTITAPAGQSYILQNFEKRWRYGFDDSGTYWLSSIHSGDAADSVDATSILTRRLRFSSERYFDSRAVKLSSKTRYERRFNLLDTLTLYVEITEAGRYVVSGQGEGVKARFRVEPFLTYRPRDYQSPPFEDSGHPWNLDAGFYVVTAKPELKGIITLSIKKESMEKEGAKLNNTPQTSVAGATRYGPVYLDGDSYTLYINQQPGVKAGVVLRRMPVDLSTALPVMQFGGEVLDIPVTLPEVGSVRAITTSGAALQISTDKQNWSDSLTLAKGRYDISIRNTGNDTVNYSLQFAATRLSVTEPLPPIDDKTLRSIPDFPTLTDKQPEYFDLDRNQPATYLVKVDKPALYRLESSGLLETEGNLRTRTIPSLVRQQANGVGRNFLIQQYLREGDYQLTLQPRYKTRGHLGLSLSRTGIEDDGLLTTDVASRATLRAGQGLTYRFSIKRKGTYRLRAIGVNRTYVMRVEDADGWPILKPNIDADITQEFDPGDYRVIIRPEAVDARVVTTLEPINEPVKFQGHGPHPVMLNEAVNHEWLEPSKDPSLKENARVADIWRFELPAAADTTIALSSEMQGELVTVDQPEHVLASVSSLKPWQGELAAGHYQLALKNARHNNHVEYRLTVSTRQLLAGQQRQVNAPASLPVSVGDDGFIELYSYGQSDVRAALYDSRNTLVARNDDRSNDWNFLIGQSLPAGEYRLQVDTLGDAGQPTLVKMRTPSTHLENNQSLPVKTTITDTQAHIFPLKLPTKDAVLVIQADSMDAVGISMEASGVGPQSSNWKVLGTGTGKAARLLLPIAKNPSQAYRLRVWSIDRRGAAINLNAQAIEPSRYQERQLPDIALTPISGAEPVVAIAALELSHPGLFKVEDVNELLWSSQTDQSFTTAQNGLIPVSGDVLWIAKLSEDNKPVKLKLSRVYLDDKDTSKLQVLIPAQQSGHLDLKVNSKHTDAPILAITESRTGQPGIQLINKSDSETQNAAQCMAIAQKSAVSVAVGADHPMIKLWNADDQHQALEVSVRQMPFYAVNRQSAADGEFQYPLQSRTALELVLSAGHKRVNLVFPANTAAVLMRGDKIVSTHWSGKTSLNEVANGNIDKILVLNAATQTQNIRLTIDSLPLNSAFGDNLLSPVLSENHMFQRRVAGIGQLRLPVNRNGDSGESYLRVRGTAQATYIQEDGRILQGEDMLINGNGVLVLNHQAGVILAWLESSSPKNTALANIQPLKLDSPQTIALQGEEQAFRLEAKQGRQLLLRSDSPLITRVRYPSGRQVIEAHPDGVAYSLYLPEGVTVVALQGMGATALNGVAFVSAAAIEPIKEGFGPETILSGGSSRLYGFDVTESGPVGLGVQASADVASGVLMDDSGNVVGQGAVQMPQLTPGHYVFAVSVPKNSLPVRLRPALVGLEKPPTGPPAEVIKQYLEQSGLKLGK